MAERRDAHEVTPVHAVSCNAACEQKCGIKKEIRCIIERIVL